MVNFQRPYWRLPTSSRTKMQLTKSKRQHHDFLSSNQFKELLVPVEPSRLTSSCKFNRWNLSVKLSSTSSWSNLHPLSCKAVKISNWVNSGSKKAKIRQISNRWSLKSICSTTCYKECLVVKEMVRTQEPPCPSKQLDLLDMRTKERERLDTNQLRGTISMRTQTIYKS